MTEDSAHGMSASHGCIDDKAVVQSFKEALKQRIGDDRFRMWFTDQVMISLESSDPLAKTANLADGAVDGSQDVKIFNRRLAVTVKGEFAQQRLMRTLMSEMRGAAMQACGETTDVVVEVAERPSRQAELPLGDASSIEESQHGESLADGANPSGRKHLLVDQRFDPKPAARRRPQFRGHTSKLESLITQGFTAGTERQVGPRVGLRPLADHQLVQPTLPFGEGDGSTNQQPRLTKDTSGASGQALIASDTAAKVPAEGSPAMTLSSFVVSDSNRLAYTAASLVVQNPGTASPLFLAGPTGVGKTHLLTALADALRRHHRMRRVVHTSAERFTNEFIAAIRESTMTSFRRRYRDVDALLIDDVQFLGRKAATLREMLYTVDDLGKAGRPMVFSGSQTPSDTPGLSGELAGRLSSGLVCNLQAMDVRVREMLLRRMIDQRCEIAWPVEVISEISAVVVGDGRVVGGVVNLVAALQRMYKRMPTMDEIRQVGGDLLRSASRSVNLSTIERAVCEAFRLETGLLQTHVQTRSVSEPRMLAMYLSRQLTSSAFAEISRHFGGRSHSTAIMASKRVEEWLTNGKTIGRGVDAMSAREALHRIENILRAG